MPEFLVEVYVSRTDAPDVEQARRAAVELSREHAPVRYVRSIFVPEDETCFLLFEAATAEDACEAARRAAFRFERVTEVISEPTGRRLRAVGRRRLSQ